MSYSRSMWIARVVLRLLLLRSVAGQHTGLFLSIQGTAIDNDSFVDLESIGSGQQFRLFCHTNATDCCTGDLTPAGMDGVGDWFFPNGMPLLSFITSSGSRRDGFTRERGQSVVGLIKFNAAPERGRFRCELLGDTIYVNILDFRPVSPITPSNPTVTAGQSVTLQCSLFFDTNPIPANSATPVFEWFFGSQPLTATTTTNSGSTYTSTYSITSTRVSDEGMYTCRLRGNQRTARSTMVTIRPATVTPSITASGTNTAGETYSLVCSVTVTGLPNPPTPTFTWSGPMNNPAPSGMVSADGSMSTLTFNPLSAPSHAGTYTCTAEIASLGGSGQDTSTVQVNVPDIRAVVTPSSSSSLTLGQTGFSLTCDVSGTDNLNSPTLTYEWRRRGGVVPNQQERTLSLSPLSGSQVGMYICVVTVDSTLLNSAEMRTSGTHTVSAQISSPSSVSVTSDPSFFDTAGTNVTVICRVELGSAVTDPSQITVDAQLTYSGCRELQTTGPTREGTTFTFTVIVSSFKPSNDGNYVCTANVTSQSPFITGFATGTGVMEIGIGILTIGPTTEVSQGSTLASICSSEVGRAVAITVGVIVGIECLIALPVVISVIALCWRKRNKSNDGQAAAAVLSGVGEGQVYEEPDKFATAYRTQGDYELTECPAYATSQPQTQVQSSTNDYDNF